MISNTVINEVRRLLLEKQYSQRKIALRLGVSRGTVNSIATGKRLDYPQRDYTGESGEGGFIPPAGLPRRCPRCGAKVMLPCLACHVRALSARRTIDRQAGDSPRSGRC
ncbi:MAG: helix-turn-helix transcriptional regulator [Planctomycetota bacterium]|nr:helix-turn-helix transcriptional regulator [Planctomycetota bacterium]